MCRWHRFSVSTSSLYHRVTIVVGAGVSVGASWKRMLPLQHIIELSPTNSFISVWWWTARAARRWRHRRPKVCRLLNGEHIAVICGVSSVVCSVSYLYVLNAPALPSGVASSKPKVGKVSWRHIDVQSSHTRRVTLTHVIYIMRHWLLRRVGSRQTVSRSGSYKTI